jgi:DNA-directed RNA polymerase sigma subunit (sigma70/sigma32)
LSEVITDPGGESPVEKVSQSELKWLIFERLKELPEMQRKVLALYYGEDLHLREIAGVFGLTESRICQIHSQAIISIRAYLQRFEAGLAKQIASAYQNGNPAAAAGTSTAAQATGNQNTQRRCRRLI